MKGKQLTKEEFIERFWDKVDKTGDCWEWTGSRNASGYGQFNNKPFGTSAAHRISFLLSVGEILPGNVICHRCDNPPCVNPDHLFQGTHADNMQDAINKGRLVGPFGDRVSKKTEKKRGVIDKLKEEIKEQAHKIIELEARKITTKTKTVIVKEKCKCYKPEPQLNQPFTKIDKIKLAKSDKDKLELFDLQSDIIKDIIKDGPYENSIILNEAQTNMFNKNMVYTLEHAILDIISHNYKENDIKCKLRFAMLQLQKIRSEFYNKYGKFK